MDTQINKLQINCSVRTSPDGTVLDKSMLINIRTDEVMEAVQLFNSLRTKLNAAGAIKNFNPILAEPATEETQYISESSPVPTTSTCPKCQRGRLVKRTGRYGEFLACSNYPDCKYTNPIKNTYD